jgi:hypothetical protein
MKNKKTTLFLIIGLLLRFFLMFVGFHDDLRAIVFGGFLAVKQGQLFSFYDYLSNLGRSNQFVQKFGPYLFIYPPLAYLIPGMFLLILSPLINFDFLFSYLLNPRNYLGTLQLMKHLFLFKLPYLVFDLGLAYFLSQLFAKKDKNKVLTLWLFNPITLYASFAMGQLDIFPLFFVVLALYFALKKKNNQLSLAVLGIGGAFKLFPLLLIPVFSLVLSKDLLTRLKFVFIGLGTYGLTVLPYLLTSPGYRTGALLANQTNKMFYMQLPVTSAEGLPLFSLIYILILLLAFYQKNIFANKELGLWTAGLSVLGLFYSLTHYHPQWFLWFTPFLIYFLVKYKSKLVLPISLILISFMVHLIFFDASLHIGLLSGGFSQLENSKSLTRLLNFPAKFWRNNFRAVSTASIIYVYTFVNSRLKTKNE